MSTVCFGSVPALHGAGVPAVRLARPGAARPRLGRRRRRQDAQVPLSVGARSYPTGPGRQGFRAKAFATAITGCRIRRSEEHTSELQSLMRISYAVFCLTKKKTH